MKATIYVDLDGTLLDIRERYYALHCSLLRDAGGQAGRREEFWDLKQRQASPELLLPALDAAARERYRERWLELIESEPYLAFDRPLPGAVETLASLHGEYRLVLVTLRRDGRLLSDQLRRHGIDHMLDGVFSRAGAGAHAAKQDLISNDSRPASEPALVVGDTEADIEAARSLGLPAACVLTGIRQRPFLSALEPAFLLDSIVELPDALDANAAGPPLWISSSQAVSTSGNARRDESR